MSVSIIWVSLPDTRLARSKEQAALHARKIAELDKESDRLVDRLVEADNKTVIAAIEKRIARLDTEKLLLAEKAELSGKPGRPFAQMFELAIAFLSNPCALWESGRFELQRLMLKLTLAGPISYNRETGFRTPELSIPFKALGQEYRGKCEMAERSV